jgi:glycolate oxidase FAD binding subunit
VTIDLDKQPISRPASVPELGERIRQAAAAGEALYPAGGRTMLDLGLPPTRPGCCIDLRGLDQVIDYPARDMTITVQAGITIERLQDILRGERQQLPVDVPRAGQATLGGILATNTSGPRRLGHGTLRDYLIGISFMTDEGVEAKAGGRVVKNVAGYDLCKLHIGALGTLGILTQATLKLRPLPEERAVVLLTVSASAVAGLLDALHQSRTRPVCVELLNRSAVTALNQRHAGLLPAGDFVVVAGFEEKQETVAWQVQQLITELPAGLVQDVEARVGAPAEPVWRELTEFRFPNAAEFARIPSPAGERNCGQFRHECVLSFKANLLPSRVAEFVALAGEDSWLQAQAQSGIVIGHATAGLTAESARSMLGKLLAQAVAAQGNLVVLRCPPEWKATLPIWGAPRGDLELMRAVKTKLDPMNLFNPGRYLV